MYLAFLKKYKVYVAIILAVLAGFLLCLFLIRPKTDTVSSVEKTSSASDENLVYFDVNSKEEPSIPQQNKTDIDESDLKTDEYNQEMVDVLAPKSKLKLPKDEPEIFAEVPNSYSPKSYRHKKRFNYQKNLSHKNKTYKKTAKLPYIGAFWDIPQKIISKVKPCIHPTILMPSTAAISIKATKLEYANAFDVANFINKNVQTTSSSNIAIAKGNNEIIIKGTEKEISTAEQIIGLLDTRPKVAVFKLNYTKPCKMANMIANTIFNGNCNVAAEGCEIAQKTSPYAIYYNSNQNSITIVGASKKQMDLTEEFIHFSDIKSPQAFLDILVVEFNEIGSRQFQKLAQFNCSQDDENYSISSRNLYSSITNIIYGGGGKILARPRLTIANDSDYNINVTSDYVHSKQSKDVYNIEDCGTKLKIHSLINPKGEVFLTLEPQYVTVKRSIPNERNAKATLFNRKSFRIENVKLQNKQTLSFGGVNSQQIYKSLGRSKTINTELMMFVNVHILD